MLADNIKTFLAHKKIIWVLIISAVLLGLFEQYLVGGPADYMDKEALNYDPSWFILINLLNYVIFIGAVVVLFPKLYCLRYVSRLSVVLSLIKAGFFLYYWVCFSTQALYQLLLVAGPFKPADVSLFTLSPLGLFTAIVIMFCVVCFYYSLFITIFLGALSRSIFRQTPIKTRSGLAALYLPLSCIWWAFKLPLVWLSLAVAFAFKLSGFLLLYAGLPYIQLITEPLAMLALLFSFYIGYEVYLQQHVSKIVSDVQARH